MFPLLAFRVLSLHSEVCDSVRSVVSSLRKRSVSGCCNFSMVRNSVYQILILNLILPISNVFFFRSLKEELSTDSYSQMSRVQILFALLTCLVKLLVDLFQFSLMQYEENNGTQGVNILNDIIIVQYFNFARPVKNL